MVLIFAFSFQDESQRKIEEIKMLREKMKEISQEAHNKDDLHKQLVFNNLMLKIVIKT